VKRNADDRVHDCVENTGDSRDENNSLLLQILRDRVQQLCADSFNDHIMVYHGLQRY